MLRGVSSRGKEQDRKRDDEYEGNLFFHFILTSMAQMM